MRLVLAGFALLLLAIISSGFGQQQEPKEKPKENPPPADTPKPSTPDAAKPADAANSADAAKPAGGDRKNPVAATPENLAAAKKMFGYDCAMCHGAAGDGKGDMVESMKLTMKNWRDVAALTGISDGEMFEIIIKGKGKMTGEGDRLPPNQVWGMVNYVRSLAKKGSATTGASDAAPKQ